MNNYKILCECWDKKVLKEGTDPGVAIVSNAIGIGAGIGGIVLRNKRQEMLFQKIMAKFPTAKSLKEFLRSQGKNAMTLSDDATEYEYAYWVKKNIVKEGKFFRIMAQVLMFGLLGGIYNGIRYASENGRPAEESINANY